ncbi:hypothetical protein AAG906_020704 [Vitis piasezkii]
MIKSRVKEFRGQVGFLEEEIALLKRVVLPGTPSISEPYLAKVQVPEPKPFAGAWNAKDLENFIGDMNQYFNVARIPTNELVMITSMYFSGDAKLWWRMRTSDVMWLGDHRKQPNDQFLLANTMWVARSL